MPILYNANIDCETAGIVTCGARIRRTRGTYRAELQIQFSKCYFNFLLSLGSNFHLLGSFRSSSPALAPFIYLIIKYYRPLSIRSLAIKRYFYLLNICNTFHLLQMYFCNS